MNQNKTQPGSGASGPKGRSLLPIILGSLGAVVVIGGALLVFLAQMQTTGVSGFESADGRALLEGLADDRLPEARTVTIEAEGGGLTLERAEAGWRLAEADGYPVREGAVDEFLRALSDLRAVYVSAREAPPYAEYGVNAPGTPPVATTRVSVLNGDGETMARASFGHAFSAPGASQDRAVFVRIADDPRVWLADGALSVPMEPNDWLNNRILDIPGERVRRLALSGAGSEPVEVVRGKEGMLELAERPSGDVELKGQWVLDMLSGLFSRLTFERVRAFDSLPGGVEAVREAVVETDDGVAYTVRLLSRGRDPAAAETAAATEEEIWGTLSAEVAAGANGEDAARTAELFNGRHSGWAYVLPLYFVERLSVGPDDILK
jgi:hypothetical protein